MAICRVCKADLGEVYEIPIDGCILIGKSAYYHEVCYKTREIVDKGQNKDVVDMIVSKGKCDLSERVEQEKSKKAQQEEKKKTGKERDEFVNWIQENYGIDFLSSLFFTKIASVANGTHRGLREPIPYPDLLDMFQRKKKQFDVKFSYKQFDTAYSRFCYDLSVIMSQYDSYKNWKVTRELELEAIRDNAEFHKRIANSKNVANTTKNNHQEIVVDPIASAVDDIFG